MLEPDNATLLKMTSLTSILRWVFRFFTTYVAYSMIIVGNIGTVMLIAGTGITNQIVGLLFWVILFDIGTIALTLYYRNKPVPVKISAK